MVLALYDFKAAQEGDLSIVKVNVKIAAEQSVVKKFLMQLISP
jgi:hypothetical protein